MTYDTTSIDGGTLSFGNYKERRSFGVAFRNFSQNLPVVPTVSLRDKGDQVTYVDFFFGSILEEENHGIYDLSSSNEEIYKCCQFKMADVATDCLLHLLNQAKELFAGFLSDIKNTQDGIEETMFQNPFLMVPIPHPEEKIRENCPGINTFRSDRR